MDRNTRFFVVDEQSLRQHLDPLEQDVFTRLLGKITIGRAVKEVTPAVEEPCGCLMCHQCYAQG